MKRLMIIILLVVFLDSFISALDVEFNCPSFVKVGEEFDCEISFEGNYDVKVDLLCGGRRCAKIWNGEFWGSTYYFVEDFSEEDVRLKIVENYNGNCEGKLRLRKIGSSGYNYEESFSIGVVGGGDFVGVGSEEVIINGSEEIRENEIIKLSDKNNQEGIVLNSISEDGGGEVVYVSKNEKIKNLGIYGFALFLIFVIVVLVLRR